MWLLLSLTFSLENGLARKPPMGWMAWEQFHCVSDCSAFPDSCISENLFVRTIDRIAADGWLAAGYEFVNIDDCWASKSRTAAGELQSDPDRFPHGIAWLANYAHSKGVKLGIYNDYGTLTCGGYPGSEAHLIRDAQTFANWEVDMLKMDGCYSNTLDMYDSYPGMSFFLNATGRPIVYSCSWPAYDEAMDYSQLPPYCNLWRNWDDIESNWASVKRIIDKWGNMTSWIQWAGPGAWNDPDQLMIGMTPNSWVHGLTAEESRSQMAIWAIVAAPLIMSNDLANVSVWAREILLNTEVIELDQDELGAQGWRVTQYDNDASVWARKLSNGDYGVALWNRGDETRDITATFTDFSPYSSVALRDLWAHQDIGSFTGSYTAHEVAPHDTVLLRMRAY